MTCGGGKVGLLLYSFGKKASMGGKKKVKGLQTPQKENDNQIQYLRSLALCLEK